jgi:pimeloyl-ACP methyl ester carboxylesterase
MPTPPFKHAQLQWYHWFQATKRGAAAVKANPIGFAQIMWENWSPAGWFTQEEFDRTALSWENADFADVTLHSYQARWDEAEPDPDSLELEQLVKSTKTLSLPVLYIQGDADGVNPPYVSEHVYEKYTSYFERVVLPGVGHFPTREAPEILAAYLLKFLRN